MHVFGYLPKLKRTLGLAFGPDFLHTVSIKLLSFGEKKAKNTGDTNFKEAIFGTIFYVQDLISVVDLLGIVSEI